jgi:hypothetical protein
MTKAKSVLSTPRRTASKTKSPPTKKSTSSPPAGPAADPIWAVIEKHRQERAAYAKALREEWHGDIDIPRDATDEILAAGHTLLTTRPTTLLGTIALLRYVRSQEDKGDPYDAMGPTFLPSEIDGEFWAHAFFETIADALAALCGREAVAS